MFYRRVREYGKTGCGDTCGGGGVFTKRKTELLRRNLLYVDKAIANTPRSPRFFFIIAF